MNYKIYTTLKAKAVARSNVIFTWLVFCAQMTQFITNTYVASNLKSTHGRGSFLNFKYSIL